MRQTIITLAVVVALFLLQVGTALADKSIVWGD
jgi:hypothetical protein